MADTPPALRAPFGPRLRNYLITPRGASAIGELDGFRALAILLVLLRHAVRPFWTGNSGLLPVAGWDVAIPLVNGWMGVDLFFVLSGFLIAHHLCGRYRRRDGRIDFGDYLVRRALRIVPAYYVVLLVVAAGWVPAYELNTRHLGIRVGYHLLFLQDYLPANILVTFWSLGVEEKFYLLSPFLLLAVFRLGRARWQYLAIAALALLPTVFRARAAATAGPLDYEAFFVHFRSPFHMSFDGLAIGVLCALLYRDRSTLAWTASARAAGGLFWCGTAVLLAALTWQPLLDQIGVFDLVFLQTVLAIAGGAMMFGLILGAGPGSWFRSGWTLVLSRLAYCLYLVHYALVPGTRALVSTVPGFETLARGVQFMLFLPVFLLVSAVVALALHYLVEKPFLLLRDRSRPIAATAASKPA